MAGAVQLCANLGITPTALISLVSPLLSIPCCFALRQISNPTLRHAFAAISGLLLAFMAFGPTIWVHYALLLTFTYTAMVLYRKRCGIITLLGTFSYLVACHVAYESGKARRDQGIDFAGTLMMVTLKLTSCAFDYQDGLYLTDAGAPVQASAAAAAGKPIRGHQRHVRDLPSLLEFFGYVFCGGLHLTGPFFEIRPYLQWTNQQGVWAPAAKRASFLVPLLTALAWAVPSGLLHLVLKPRVDLALVTDPQRFWNISYVQRWGHVILSTYAVRTKIYYVWTVAEASMVAAGLGFSGWVPAATTGAQQKVQDAAQQQQQPKQQKRVSRVFRRNAVLKKSMPFSQWEESTPGFEVADGVQEQHRSALPSSSSLTVNEVSATGTGSVGVIELDAGGVLSASVSSGGRITTSRSGTARVSERIVSRSRSNGHKHVTSTVTNTVSAGGLMAQGMLSDNSDDENSALVECDYSEGNTAGSICRQRKAAAAAAAEVPELKPSVQKQGGASKASVAAAPEPPKLVASWHRAKNINIWGVEAVTGFHGYAKNWNTATGAWLRTYIYERVTPEGQKPGMLPLVLTVCTSAVWHGIYIGDFMFALSSAFLIMGSRIIYRYQCTLPPASTLSARFYSSTIAALHSAYSFFGLNYSAMGFIVLSASDTFTVFRGLGFVGTLLPLVVLAIVRVGKWVNRVVGGERKVAKAGLSEKCVVAAHKKAQ